MVQIDFDSKSWVQLAELSQNLHMSVQNVLILAADKDIHLTHYIMGEPNKIRYSVKKFSRQNQMDFINKLNALASGVVLPSKTSSAERIWVPTEWAVRVIKCIAQ